MRHGQPDTEFPVEVFLGDDPELALVNADMAAWDEAHPCRCDDNTGICLCNENDDVP